MTKRVSFRRTFSIGSKTTSDEKRSFGEYLPEYIRGTIPIPAADELASHVKAAFPVL
jgi:hypothetical protein